MLIEFERFFGTKICLKLWRRKGVVPVVPKKSLIQKNKGCWASSQRMKRSRPSVGERPTSVKISEAKAPAKGQSCSWSEGSPPGMVLKPCK